MLGDRHTSVRIPVLSLFAYICLGPLRSRCQDTIRRAGDVLEERPVKETGCRSATAKERKDRTGWKEMHCRVPGRGSQVGAPLEEALCHAWSLAGHPGGVPAAGIFGKLLHFLMLQSPYL